MFRMLIVFLALFAQSLQAAPQIERFETQNGINVLFVAAPELPMVDFRLVFDAGSARDGANYGIANLTNHMLLKGTQDISEEEVVERFESMGSVANTESYKDMAVVSLRSITEKPILDKSIALLSTLIKQPAFDEAVLSREKQRLLLAFKEQEKSIDALANKAFMKALYADHPYAHGSSGTAETVEALTAEDLKVFYKRFYVGKNAVLAIVGDLTLEQAKQYAQRLTEGLVSGTKPAALNKPQAQPATMEHVELNTTQTQVSLGHLGVERGHPDYFALYLGNHALGGSGLNSRLMKEIREKRGLTYGVYSYFNPMREAGPFMMSMKTRSEKAEEAVRVMKQQLQSFIETGPTEEELVFSKKNITGGFPLKINGNSKVIQYIAMIGFYGLPLDYLTTFNEKINSLSRDDVMKAWKKHMSLDKLHQVTVGDSSEK